MKKVVFFLMIIFILTGCSNVEPKNTTYKNDIIYIKEELAKKQVNIYENISKKEYEEKFNKLSDEYVGIDKISIKMRILEILKNIKDSNIDIKLDIDQKVPVKFVALEDGYFLVSTIEYNKKFLGKKLVKINNIDVDEIFKRIEPFIVYEDISLAYYKFSEYLSNFDILKYFGIIDNTNIIYYEMEDEKSKKNEIMEVSLEDNKEEQIDFFKIYELKTNEEIKKNFFYKYVEGDRLIYIKINKIYDDDLKFQDFITNVFETYKNKRVEHIIIDIRDCKEGDYNLFDKYFIQKLKKSEYNKKGNVFLIINENTYGAGVAVAALFIKNNINILTFGKPAFHGLNHIAKIDKIKTPNLNIEITYSSKYENILPKNYKQIKLDYNIKYYSKDFFTGKDSAYDAIVRYIKSK